MVNRMKEIRFFKGVSQWRIALHGGMSQARVSLIERGYILPSKADKKKIAQALRVRPDEVFPEETIDDNRRRDPVST